MLKSLVKLLPSKFRNQYRKNWHIFQLELKTAVTKFSRQLSRPLFPDIKKDGVNLHLGCGPIKHPKFINIDGLPAAHIHYVRAIDDLSIFDDETVDFIYACHCLEHFPYAKITTVLNEWFRVLKKGGKLRLSVPDFDLLLNIYNSNKNDLNSIEGYLLGGQNHKFNFHYSVFNREYLLKYLEDVGFQNVYEWRHECDDLCVNGDYSTFTIEASGQHYAVSLNVEAVK